MIPSMSDETPSARRSVLKVGQELRLKFGGSGATQVARIEKITPDRVGVRRYRAKSGKWNKHVEWWDRATFEREAQETKALVASRGRREFLEGFLP